MKLRLILFLFFLSTIISLAQTRVSGTITDNTTNDPLFGATIAYDGKGIISDFDGNFVFFTSNKSIEVTFSYVGYEKIVKKLELNGKPIKLEIKLNTILLNEVQVVADVAIDRKTPVAFSTIPVKNINEYVD